MNSNNKLTKVIHRIPPMVTGSSGKTLYGNKLHCNCTNNLFNCNIHCIYISLCVSEASKLGHRRGSSNLSPVCTEYT